MGPVHQAPGFFAAHGQGLQILHGLHVVEGGAVHGDHRQPQFHPGQQLPHGGLGLGGGHGEHGPVLQQAVQLHLGIGRELPVRPQDGVPDGGDEKGVRFPQPGQMHPVHDLRHRHADGGVQGAVEGVDIGAHVLGVLDADDQEHHRGEIGRLADLQQHREIQHHPGEEAHQGKVQPGLLMPPADQPLLKEQQGQAPEGAHQGAGDALAGHGAHGFGIGLDALQHRKPGIQGLPLPSPQHIDQQAQPHRDHGAQDPLAGDGELFQSIHGGLRKIHGDIINAAGSKRKLPFCPRLW